MCALVTGVQTCALPISEGKRPASSGIPNKFTHIGQTTRNSSRSRHGGRYQVRARARPLPSHEIAVRCRCAALTARHLVGIHAKTGRTAGLTPFESGFGKDAIKPLLLRLPLDKAGAWH